MDRHPLVAPLACVTALLTLGVALGAAEVETPRKKKGPSAELAQLAEEEKWVFEPPAVRLDPFFDREQVLKLEADAATQATPESGPNVGANTTDPDKDTIVYAQAELVRIETLMAGKRYDEVLKASDITLKILEKKADLPDVRDASLRISTYRDQAEEALTRNEAQEQFDALGLRIEGILWSEGGARLAIIAGEPRAIGVNERVKDCVIINIDTDRVDFRFYYKRKRFEFPRYVGEAGSVAQKKTR